MPSFSYIKSKLPIIIRPLISHHHHHHHHIPITRSIITPLITHKLFSTFNSSKTKLLLLNNNKNSTNLVKILRSRWSNYTMNNKYYLWFKAVKSHCTFPRLALAAAMSMVRIEQIPFTDRYHVVLRGPKFTWLSSICRELMSDSWIIVLFDDNEEYKTLETSNSEVIRVTNTVAELIKTTHSVFGLEKESIVTNYVPPTDRSKPVLDKYVIGSPKNHPSALLGSTTRKGKPYATKHLEGREWKVTVIESPEIDAGLLPNSTIYITTSLLNNLSDIELTTVMAREIGRYIAAHRFDYIWSNVTELFIHIPAMILTYYLAPSYYPRVEKWSLSDDLSGLDRHEFEADFISLMLVAWMGYDPQEAIKFYEKEYCEYKIRDDFPKPPSRFQRIESLQNHEKMDKVMNAYWQAKLDNGIRIKKITNHNNIWVKI